MKKYVAVFCFVAFVGTLVLPMAMGDAHDNSASIVKGFGCGVIDGNGNVVFTPDGRISVVTSSGNTTLVCKAKGVAPGPDGKAVVFKDFLCGTFLGLTTDSQNTVSASGNVTLVCKVKGNP